MEGQPLQAGRVHSTHPSLHPLGLPLPTDSILQAQTGTPGWPRDFGEFPGVEREKIKLGSCTSTYGRPLYGLFGTQELCLKSSLTQHIVPGMLVIYFGCLVPEPFPLFRSCPTFDSEPTFPLKKLKMPVAGFPPPLLHRVRPVTQAPLARHPRPVIGS